MQNSINIFNNLSFETREIFNLIQKRGPVTKNNLMLLSKMKLSTLNRVMLPLEERQLIVPSGIEESTGGRKPVLYDVNPGQYYTAGIDISRTYTQVVVVNLKTKIQCNLKFPMDESCSPGKTIDLIAEALNTLLKKSNIDTSMLLGVGLGTVGPLDRQKGLMFNPANFPAPGWTDIPIKSMLEEKLSLPVIIDNGANTAVLAEFLFGHGRGCKNLAYFNCGVGIRTGAIASGNIIRTINDTEDAFGHMIIDVDGEACSCGNYGCIECYSSILSVTKRFISGLKKGRFSRVTKDVNDINYIDICAAAQENDELAREVIINAATIFGAGLANYINLLSPGMVILSGPLINHSELFYQVCTDAALKKSYMAKGCNVNFSKGGYFGDNSMAAGAAAMVVEFLLGRWN